MINEEKLTEFIIAEFRKLHGDMILQKTMFDTRESQHMVNNINGIEDFFDFLRKEKEEHDNMMKLIEYNRGKQDAYVEIMNLLGHKIEK